jgi:hypothetical protein
VLPLLLILLFPLLLLLLSLRLLLLLALLLLLLLLLSLLLHAVLQLMVLRAYCIAFGFDAQALACTTAVVEGNRLAQLPWMTCTNDLQRTSQKHMGMLPICPSNANMAHEAIQICSVEIQS